MPLSNTLSSYEDIRQILDQAIDNPNGIEVEYQTPGQAVHNRQRMYKFRALEKIALLDIYPVGDDRRGFTPYDHLNFIWNRGERVVRIIHGAPVKIRSL